jgi:hypothetical protein
MRLMLNLLLLCVLAFALPLTGLFLVGMYQTLHQWGLV